MLTIVRTFPRFLGQTFLNGFAFHFLRSCQLLVILVQLLSRILELLDAFYIGQAFHSPCQFLAQSIP